MDTNDGESCSVMTNCEKTVTDKCNLIIELQYSSLSFYSRNHACHFIALFMVLVNIEPKPIWLMAKANLTLCETKIYFTS